MNNLCMIGRASTGEEVKFDAQPVPGIEKSLVVLGRDFLGCLALVLSGDGYRGSVLVTPGDHEHFVPFGAMIAGKNICWQVGAGDVSEVQGAVGVGPRHTDENPLHSGLTFLIFYHNPMLLLSLRQA